MRSRAFVREKLIASLSFSLGRYISRNSKSLMNLTSRAMVDCKNNRRVKYLRYIPRLLPLSPSSPSRYRAFTEINLQSGEPLEIFKFQIPGSVPGFRCGFSRIAARAFRELENLSGPRRRHRRRKESSNFIIQMSIVP